MAYEPHMKLTIEGEKFKGCSTQRKDMAELLAYTFTANLPFDSKTGVASGRVAYEPITVTKRLDEDSTVLLTAMSQQRKVEAEILFYRATKDSKDEHYMTVKFDHARITTIVHNAMNDPPSEDVTFSYRSVEVVWQNPKKPFKEDWRHFFT